MLWYTKLSYYLWYWHPIKVSICVQATPVQILPPAKPPGKAAEDGQSTWAPDGHMGDPEVSGSYPGQCSHLGNEPTGGQQRALCL